MKLSPDMLGDIYGGVTAAVIALPLALAFGVASGVGPIAGLYGAIAVGFFAAVFGGTNSQISGPTGPMTIVMAVIVAEHAENLGEAFTIVMLGGVFQIVFGMLRLGRYVSYTPYTVVSGFMSGIGVIIILIQILPFFGHATVSGGPLASLRVLSYAVANPNVHALAIASLTLLIMVFWPVKWRKKIPPPLVVLVIGTILGRYMLSDAPIIGEVPTGLPLLYLPNLEFSNFTRLVQPALILALLGSIDSLLTSLIADTITRTRHNSNKELIGQGIGNMVAGLIGGLPGAGATMRTVVNVRAGGRSPVSGALHAVILLGLVLGLGPFAEQIPHAVLSGILIKVGWDIIDWGYLKRILRAPKDKVFVMLITLSLTVFVDLITAVGVGLIVAGLVTARWMETEELKGVAVGALSENEDELTISERNALKSQGSRIGLISFRGYFSYASARQLVQTLENSMLVHEIVIFDFSHAAHIDTSAALSIEELIEEATRNTKACFITNLSGAAKETLLALNVLKKVNPGYIFEDRLHAIQKAIDLL